MAEQTNQSFPPVQVGPIRGNARSFQYCGILTNETQIQCGLRDEDGNFYRLFFGEQTDEESKATLASFSLEGLAVEVVVEGYSKYRSSDDREPYLDDSVIFVEKVSRAS